jgi:hypothetical protein
MNHISSAASVLKVRKMLAKSRFAIRAHPQQIQYVFLTVICLMFFAFAMAFAPEKPFLFNDSNSFIDFESDRTAGYPVILNVIGMFDAQLHTLPLIQLFIFCSATLLFAIGMDCLTGSFWCAVAVLVLMFGNYEVVKYSFWVMSDGPFISFLAASLGTFALWLAIKRSMWLATASICLGAAISIRPAGGTLLLILPIFYLYASYTLRRPGQTLALMVAPVGLVFLLSLAAYHQWHGTWSPNSNLGKNLIGKAAPLAEGNEPSARPSWITIAANVGAAYRGQFPTGARWSDRVLLDAPLYDQIRHSLGVFSEPVSAFPADELGTGPTRDRALTSLALDIIRAHKVAFLREVLENYAALWYIPQLLTRDDVGRLKDIIARQGLVDADSYVEGLVRPWLVVRSIHLFQLCIFLISIIFLVALPVELTLRHRANVFVWFGFAGSAVLHSSILLVAAVNEAKPRLSLDYWPLEVLLAVLALAAVQRVISKLIFPQLLQRATLAVST